MFISSRIRTIGEFVNANDSVADVGADHGLLEIYLLARHRDIKILAIENKKGPYKILENNLIAYKNITLSLSDGLTKIGKNIDTVIIAGMGGLNIKQILDESKEKLPQIKKIIIDAHRDIALARRIIVKYGYKIQSEKIVYEDGKYYVIICFINNGKVKRYSRDELDFGYKLYEDKLWPEFSNYLVKKNQNIIYKIQDKRGTQDKVLKLKKINERIRNYGKD